MEIGTWLALSWIGKPLPAAKIGVASSGQSDASIGCGFDSKASASSSRELGFIVDASGAEEESPVGSRGDALAQAVLEQSKALTSLVAQLQQGGDPLLDAQHLPSGSSSRGAAGRERLQRELRGRSGGFFLQVLQNAHRRMKPAAALPQTLEEISQTDFSLCQYLERYRGYGQARELGSTCSALWQMRL